MIYHPFRHLGLKALSVAIALLLWLAVSGEQVVERSLRVPLVLQNVPQNLELVDIPPSMVDVRVRGASGLLSHLASGDMVAMLDLSSARPGRRIFSLTPEHVQGPSGVQVGQVSPPTITIEFERSGTRSVRVDPQTEGEPAAGYAIGGISCQPPMAEVAGPDTQLRQLTHIITEPVSVAGATRPVRETVTMGVPSPGLRLVTQTKATVTVDIRPAAVERTIPGVVVRLLNVPAGRAGQVTPRDVTVRVKGPKEIVEGLTPQAFVGSVDLAGLRPGRYNLQVRLDPLQRVEVVGIAPATVVARLK